MKIGRITAVVACLAVLGLSACGGDDGNGQAAGPTTTLDAGVRNRIEGGLGGSSTTAADTKEPATMDEWEALWAEERAAIVQRIEDAGGTSADGRTAKGPGGFTLDLSKCPAGWSNTEGIDGNTIKIGMPGPLSGPVADAGNIMKGAAAILTAYSKAGAFKDSNGVTRNVEVVMRDDIYDPSRTVALVDELIDSEKVFALDVIGQSNFLRTYQKLNDRCIPMPFNGEGHPASGDPVNHPWSSNFLMLGSTEATILGTYLEQHIDEWGGKLKVASLVATNDTGLSTHRGFQAFLAQSPRKDDIEYISQMIEPGSPTITDPVTTLAAEKPNVFVYMGPASVTCTQAIIAVAETGMDAGLKAAFQPGNCKASTYVGKERVGGDGSAADGWKIVGGGFKDFNSSDLDSDPWVAWARDQLAAAGFDYKSSASFGSGTAWGWLYAQTLQIAGALPGGLNRSNFILAMRALDMTSPSFVPGIKINMNGNEDAFLIEGSDVSHWDAASQKWVIESTIDLSGTTPVCAWDATTSVCK